MCTDGARARPRPHLEACPGPSGLPITCSFQGDKRYLHGSVRHKAGGTDGLGGAAVRRADRGAAGHFGPVPALGVLPVDTGSYRQLSQAQKAVNTAHARMRGPGERANAELKSWKILRMIRCCPTRATTLVNAVQVLILAG